MRGKKLKRNLSLIAQKSVDLEVFVQNVEWIGEDKIEVEYAEKRPYVRNLKDPARYPEPEIHRIRFVVRLEAEGPDDRKASQPSAGATARLST